MPYNWQVMSWVAIMHVAALAALHFSLAGKDSCCTLALHWITGGIGICLGFHRLLTHLSFKTYPSVRWPGVHRRPGGEGAAIDWVANIASTTLTATKKAIRTRRTKAPGGAMCSGSAVRSTANHATRTRCAGRPISPKTRSSAGSATCSFRRILCWACSLFASATSSWRRISAGRSSFWGLFVRLVFVLHCTWFVNSASHMWGYQNYETTDDSRNNWWVALLTLRRRLAQQPPRLSPHGPPRPPLVGDRCDVPHDSPHADDSGWLGTSWITSTATKRTPLSSASLSLVLCLTASRRRLRARCTNSISSPAFDNRVIPQSIGVLKPTSEVTRVQKARSRLRLAVKRERPDALVT